METLVALLLGALLVLLYYRLPAAAASTHEAVCHCHDCTQLRHGAGASASASAQSSPVKRAVSSSTPAVVPREPARVEPPSEPVSAPEAPATAEDDWPEVEVQDEPAPESSLNTHSPSFPRDPLPHLVPTFKGKPKAPGKFVCDECQPPRHFVAPFALKNHKTDAHPTRAKDKPKRPFGCRYCREGFPSYAELAAHSSAAHPERASRAGGAQDAEDPWHQPSTPAATLPCPKCLATFASEDALQEHAADAFAHSLTDSPHWPSLNKPAEQKRVVWPVSATEPDTVAEPEVVVEEEAVAPVVWGEDGWPVSPGVKDKGEDKDHDEGEAVEKEGGDDVQDVDDTSEDEGASPTSAIILTPTGAANLSENQSDTCAASPEPAGLTESTTEEAPTDDAKATSTPEASPPTLTTELAPPFSTTPAKLATTPSKSAPVYESKTPAPAARAMAHLTATSFTPVAPGADPSSPSFSFTPTPHKFSWSRNNASSTPTSGSSLVPTPDMPRPATPSQVPTASPLPPATPPSWADESLPVSPTSPTNALTRTTSASSALSSSSIWGPPANAYKTGFVTSFSQPESSPEPAPNPYGGLAGKDAPWKAAEWRLRKPIERTERPERSDRPPRKDKDRSSIPPPFPLEQREWASVPAYSEPSGDLYSRAGGQERAGRGGKKRGGGKRGGGRTAAPLQPIFDEWTNLETAAATGKPKAPSVGSSSSGQSVRGHGRGRGASFASRGGRGGAARQREAHVPGSTGWVDQHVLPQPIAADGEDPYGGW
ncbi:uncharacterized protein LOC62_03G003886 [Vanrija pseudolonga]|uniref:C2H2-type domain-containing protein n=1 Tax=Vanrija pseudolonga TaxID=143232 RepID=A0AAF1BL42_9TREE|nr:hypothetical protein LOC62_03G003886 [Vanrija pseudolonga]